MEQFSPLDAITPIDGRARELTKPLAQYFSWLGQNRYLIFVELEYVKALAQELGNSFDDDDLKLAGEILEKYSFEDGLRIWKIYTEIRHDIKAVERYLAEHFTATRLEKFVPLLHFGLTSADVENLACALRLKEFIAERYLPKLESSKERLAGLAELWKRVPMLARTHGRPAVPTTAGKEIINFAVRLHRLASELKKTAYYGKLNGAVGNYSALAAAYPEKDWIAFSKKFVSGLGLEPLTWTTQIPPYDYLVSLLDRLRLINTVLVGLCRDIWRYASDGYFVLSHEASEVGSSTMPQKVNPIDFEGAEANFLSANALLEHLSRSLPANRLQRDLTDKYLLRDIGPAMAYAWIGLEYLMRGLKKIALNPRSIEHALSQHWEVLAEGVQTILRAEGYADAYETVRAKTQGRTLGRLEYLDLVGNLDVPEDLKQRLSKLSPETYLGKAVELTEEGIKYCRSSHP